MGGHRLPMGADGKNLVQNSENDPTVVLPSLEVAIVSNGTILSVGEYIEAIAV